jgi:radical SAM protein with 4Fe4S-binding SPASM domain
MDTLLRFNEEYFGFICAYPTGEIRLLKESARDLLYGNASCDQLEQHLLERLVVHDGFYLNTPPLIWLEITRRCNLLCDHCYISAGSPRNNELETARILELLDEMADMGVWAVALTGGEPAMHPDFVQIVNYAHDCGLLVGIATNGLLLSESTLRELPKKGVIISVSIDDLHIDKNGTNNNFAKATSILKTCINLGFNANIMTNTHRYNLHSLSIIMDWAQAHGISVRSVPFSPLGRGKIHKELENSLDDLEIAADFWLRECEHEHLYHRRVGLCVGAIFNYGLTLAYMTQRCSSGRYLCYICSDGTVYPCTMCAGEEILSPGSVRSQELKTLWRSNWEIRNYSWSNFSNTCRGCAVNKPEYYCASRCPAMSHARHGQMFSCGASEFEKQSTILRTKLLKTKPALCDDTAESSTEVYQSDTPCVF